MANYYFDPFNNQNNNGSNATIPSIDSERLAKSIKIKQEQSELRKIGLGLGCAILAYLIIQTIVAEFISALGLRLIFSTDPLFQDSFYILFISILSVALPFGVVALIFRKKYEYPIIPNKKIDVKLCTLWVLCGLATCMFANIIVSQLIEFVKKYFGYQLTQGSTLTPNSVLTCVFEVVSMAIMPAICEEFAMRCCSLQLLRKYGKGFAIFAVSMVFGLLHGNVIQFSFAFIIALILCFVTIATDSIVPAILIHACNNGLSAVYNILAYGAGEKIAIVVQSLIFISWMILGSISFFILLFKGKFKLKKEPKKTVLNLWQKIVAFLPGMIIPILLLIALTIQTIKKI